MTKKDLEKILQNNDIFDKSITLLPSNHRKSLWGVMDNNLNKDPSRENHLY